MGVNKNMPINGIIEPDFLDHLTKTFKRWNELFENGVSVGSREIAKFSATMQGAKMNARFGFEWAMPRKTDEEGQERINLYIYKNRETMEKGMPLYYFTAKVIP